MFEIIHPDYQYYTTHFIFSSEVYRLENNIVKVKRYTVMIAINGCNNFALEFIGTKLLISFSLLAMDEFILDTQGKNE